MAQRGSLASSSLLALFRIATWSLRAKQAKTSPEDITRGLLIYWQVTFNVGYSSMHGTLVSLLRCLVMKTTKGTSSPAVEQADETGGDSDKPDDKPQANVLVPTTVPAGQDEEDQPEKRALYRRIFGLFALLSIVPFVTGPIAGNDYPNAETDATLASSVQALRSVVCVLLAADSDVLTFDRRYVSAGFIIVLFHIFNGLGAWSMLKIPRIRRSAVLVLIVLESILVCFSPFLIQASIMTPVT